MRGDEGAGMCNVCMKLPALNCYCLKEYMKGDEGTGMCPVCMKLPALNCYCLKEYLYYEVGGHDSYVYNMTSIWRPCYYQ